MALHQILDRFDNNILHSTVLYFLDGIKFVVKERLLSDGGEKIRDKDGYFLPDETFDGLN